MNEFVGGDTKLFKPQVSDSEERRKIAVSWFWLLGGLMVLYHRQRNGLAWMVGRDRGVERGAPVPCCLFCGLLREYANGGGCSLAFVRFGPHS